jgi:uncharacterized protein YcsI (UPF0317 family)
MKNKTNFDWKRFTLVEGPLLDVIVGNPPVSRLAENSDLRFDLPRYRIWHQGKVIDEPFEANKYWPADAVSFLLGCSFTFEDDLKRRNLLLKDSSTVPMYRTQADNVRSGVFQGKLVVSMRQFKSEDVAEVVAITEQHQLSHGAPVAIGLDEAKETLGLSDLNNPDFGERPKPNVRKENGLIPLFWACGVTPQSAIESARLDDIMITHAPGCMFITDISADLDAQHSS